MSTTTRLARTALLALALSAGAVTEGLASIPQALPLSGRVEAASVRVRETGSESRITVAYAAPAIPALRPAEAPTTVETPPVPARTDTLAPRKTCPAKSWPNLAPRCVADLGARS